MINEVKRENEAALKTLTAGKDKNSPLGREEGATNSSALSFIQAHGISASPNRTVNGSLNRGKIISKTSKKDGSRERQTPTNAYFDSYQKMNSLMQTLQSTMHKASKPSLKSSTGPNIMVNTNSAIRVSGLDSIYAGLQNAQITGGANVRDPRHSSPLTREMQA